MWLSQHAMKEYITYLRAVELKVDVAAGMGVACSYQVIAKLEHQSFPSSLVENRDLWDA